MSYLDYEEDISLELAGEKCPMPCDPSVREAYLEAQKTKKQRQKEFRKKKRDEFLNRTRDAVGDTFGEVSNLISTRAANITTVFKKKNKGEVN